MSIILDALRKSETERQRSEAPGLADARFIASPGRRSLWVPIVAIILFANLVLMGLWWHQSSSNNSLPQVDATQPTTRENPRVTPVVRTPMVRSLDQEIVSTRPTTVNRTEEKSPALAAPIQAPEPFLQAKDPGNTSTENLPDLMQLTLSGDVVLPPLNIDLHVFSSNPASRMVFINGSRYKEGEKLEQGPKLSEITPAGVILEHQGFRFIVNKE